MQYFLCEFFDQMQVSSREQLPPWQTKVVDKCLSPLPTGTMGLGLVCCNDVASSKPNTLGRGVNDDSQTSGISMGTVMCCGRRKCMTCSHLVQGDTFTSKTDDSLVVYTLFNKSNRKYRKRKPHRQRRKVDVEDVSKEVKNIAQVSEVYLRTYVMSLRKIGCMIEHLVLSEQVPLRLLLVQDMMAYRFRCKSPVQTDRDDNNDERSYMNVLFHNKGMNMIDLLRILNCKKVRKTILRYLRAPPPIVSYTYTKTIAGKIFNNR